MIVRNLKVLSVLLIGIIVGVGIGTIDFGKAELDFGWDDDGKFVLIWTVLPSEIVSTLSTNDAVTNILVSEEDGTTQIWYDEELTTATEQEIKDYFEKVEWVFERNKKSVVTFPGYPMPKCEWDYGTNQKIGVYWYNGQQVIVQGDGKCIED